MTSWQSRPDADLEVTLEQLARMQRALAELYRERARYGDEWFAVMAEGPLDEISRLETEVDRLTGRAAIEAAATDDRAELWMRIEGRGLAWPRAPTSVLTQFLDTLRKGVQVVAEWCETHGVSKRPTTSVKDACDFEVVMFAPGSVRVGVQLPEPSQPSLPIDGSGATAREAFALYLSAAAWAGDPESSIASIESLGSDPVLRRLLLVQVKRLLPRPRGRVEAVELSGRAVPGRKRVHLDRSAHERIDRVLVTQPDAITEIFEGDLREIDLDRRSFTLRNVLGQPVAVQIACIYGTELDETAYEAIDQRVVVVGERRLVAQRGSLPLNVVRLSVVGDGEDIEHSPD